MNFASFRYIQGMENTRYNKWHTNRKNQYTFVSKRTADYPKVELSLVSTDGVWSLTARIEGDGIFAKNPRLSTSTDVAAVQREALYWAEGYAVAAWFRDQIAKLEIQKEEYTCMLAHIQNLAIQRTIKK